MRTRPGTVLLFNIKHEALHRSDGRTRSDGGIPGSLFQSNFSKEIFIISRLQRCIQISTPLKFGTDRSSELDATTQDTADLLVYHQHCSVSILSRNFKYDHIHLKENAAILINISYICGYTDEPRQEVG